MPLIVFVLSIIWYDNAAWWCYERTVQSEWEKVAAGYPAQQAPERADRKSFQQKTGRGVDEKRGALYNSKWIQWWLVDCKIYVLSFAYVFILGQ